MFLLLLLQAVSIVVVLGISALVLYKVRKIHLVAAASSADLQVVRGESETMFQQMQSLLALERKLHLREALPSMRGWAGSPDFLLTLAREIESCRPRLIVECGSGVSTLVCARMLQLNRQGRVVSLEHDAGYADATRRMLARYGLADQATVIHAPLDTRSTKTPWYSDAALSETISDIEMVVVDGPPASTAPLARYPALPRLMPRMAADVSVIVDDASRADERAMLKQWAEEFPEFVHRDARCEKGCFVLTRRTRQVASPG